MVESALTKRKISFRLKITVKSLISAGIIALAVILPQFVHLFAGAQGGVRWLPMYLPVLLGGCLLGWSWGLGIGVLSPLTSFFITSAFGNPMPIAARLPFMMIELAIFAGISGLFSKKIVKNAWIAFPAVLLAQLAGRSAFMILVLLLQSVIPFTPAVIWGQIQAGLSGMLLQSLIVPLTVIGLKRLLVKDDND